MSKLTRRDFLKLTVVSATAASTSVITACSSSSGGTINLPASRFPQSVASGDPKANSVIIWTRVSDSSKPGADLTLSLEVSTSSSFSAGSTMAFNNLNALAANDNCLKVKVTDLNAGTTYYYRFTYAGSAGNDVSNTGRTKTAAAIGSDVEVNYALLSCQDYVGRYYNTLKRLVELSEEDGNDLDFVVQVGDYIYETSGDPSFQSVGGERSVNFSNNAEALAITKSGETFYAAQSVGNYRDLYKIYRSDEMLQKVHERFPMISTWDDHEFSDDCHKDTATYTNGQNTLPDNSRDIEQSTTRRQAAEQAYFDYMPIEPQAGTVEGADKTVTTDTAMLFPNATLYRNFQFGANFELITTDFRSYRPDHPIPENANPGAVILDGAALKATLTASGLFTATIGAIDSDAKVLLAVQGLSSSVTDLATALGAFGFITLHGTGANTGTVLSVAEEATVRLAATGAMSTNEGYPVFAASAKANIDFATGQKMSLLFYNGLATAFNAVFDAGAAPAGTVRLPELTALITKIMTDSAGSQAAQIGIGVDLGLSYAHLGKQAFFTNFGSRYLVVKDTYDLYNLYKTNVEPALAGGGAAALAAADAFDNAFGTEQWDWLLNTPSASNAVPGKILTSTAKFVGIANSVSTANIIFDFRAQTTLPATFQQRFYPNADHWDGFPIRKATMLGTIAAHAGSTAGGRTAQVGAFLMSGDIHASFISDNKPGGAASIPDFTTPATSSGTWGDFIADAYDGISSSFNAAQKALGAQALVGAGLDVTIKGGATAAAADAGALKGNELVLSDSAQHGFVTFKVTSAKVTSTYHLIPSANVSTSLYAKTAAETQALFTKKVFEYSGLHPTLQGVKEV